MRECKELAAKKPPTGQKSEGRAELLVSEDREGRSEDRGGPSGGGWRGAWESQRDGETAAAVSRKHAKPQRRDHHPPPTPSLPLLSTTSPEILTLTGNP